MRLFFAALLTLVECGEVWGAEMPCNLGILELKRIGAEDQYYAARRKQLPEAEQAELGIHFAVAFAIRNNCREALAKWKHEQSAALP